MIRKLFAFLLRLYLWNIAGIFFVAIGLFLFADRNFDERDWFQLVILFFVPLAAPLGFFFVQAARAMIGWAGDSRRDIGEVISSAKQVKSERIKRPTDRDESIHGLTESNYPKRRLPRLHWMNIFLGVISVLALKKATSLANSPNVTFIGDVSGGEATVVGVRPKGSSWVVTIQVRQSHMASSVIHTQKITKITREFAIGSMRFGVFWP
jgi:hypothetical protein